MTACEKELSDSSLFFSLLLFALRDGCLNSFCFVLPDLLVMLRGGSKYARITV